MTICDEGRGSESVTSESVTSESLTSESVTSESVTYESLTCESVTSEYVTSESVTSESVTSESKTYESLTCESVTSKSVTCGICRLTNINFQENIRPVYINLAVESSFYFHAFSCNTSMQRYVKFILHPVPIKMRQLCTHIPRSVLVLLAQYLPLIYSGLTKIYNENFRPIEAQCTEI